MSCMNVTLYNGVELQYSESEFTSHFQAIRDQLLLDMLSARI